MILRRRQLAWLVKVQKFRNSSSVDEVFRECERNKRGRRCFATRAIPRTYIFLLFLPWNHFRKNSWKQAESKQCSRLYEQHSLTLQIPSKVLLFSFYKWDSVCEQRRMQKSVCESYLWMFCQRYSQLAASGLFRMKDTHRYAFTLRYSFYMRKRERESAHCIVYVR